MKLIFEALAMMSKKYFNIPRFTFFLLSSHADVIVFFRYAVNVGDCNDSGMVSMYFLATFFY